MFEATRLATAAASVGFHVYIIFSGLLPALILRPIHLACAMPFVFVFGAKGSAPARAFGGVLCGIGLAGCAYIVFWRRDLLDQYGSLEGWWQHAVSVALLLVVLDMARRAIKPVMPSIALIVLLYGLFGEYIPGEWGHAGLPLESFLGTLVIAEGGLWGTLTGTSAELVAPFMILGAFVAAGEAGTGFLTFAQKLAGRYRAGAAKVQVIASALYGMISGSASANVASTGTITIPTMIRQGYPPMFAAATEAVASTGGQIMPPVMGAGVFLMASLIQIPYSDLMVIAAPPALLYFLTAWFGVHQSAVQMRIEATSPDAIPSWAAVARTLPFFLAPLGVLTVMLAATEYTAGYAGAVATLVAAALLPFDASLRVSWRRVADRTKEALVAAAEQIAMVASVIVCAGIITGVFHMTGLGVKITSLIVGLAGGQLWAVLLMTAIACIALGMELPTTAAYVICISVAGPALTALGLPPIQAHLFVFWYALLCTLTPPVCGNVFIAASIAETPWLPVAWRAMRLGAGLFIVPLAFVANPALLTFASSPLLTTLATIKVGLGLWCFTYAAVGGRGGAALRVVSLAASAAIIFLFGI